MLSLKRIWPKKKPSDPGIEASVPSTTSIPRQFAPASRADFPPAPPVQAPFPIETRAAERFVPRRTNTVMVTDSGKKLQARIINVSALGVAVEADFSQSSPNSIVMIGDRKVKQGRKIARGTVFLFETPLAKSLCTPDFVL